MLNNCLFFYCRIKDMETLLAHLTAGIKLAGSLYIVFIYWVSSVQNPDRPLAALYKVPVRKYKVHKSMFVANINSSLPAHRRLDELHSEEKEMLEIRVSEAQWFRKIGRPGRGVCHHRRDSKRKSILWKCLGRGHLRQRCRQSSLLGKMAFSDSLLHSCTDATAL